MLVSALIIVEMNFPWGWSLHKHKQTHQANKLACGWISRAVSPFTVCNTLMESGVRGSKNRTSPLTLVGSVKVSTTNK